MTTKSTVVDLAKVIMLVASMYSSITSADTNRTLKNQSLDTSMTSVTSLAVIEGYQDIMLQQQREANFDAFVSNELMPFWDEYAKPGQFVNKQGLKLHFVEISLSGATQTLVISPGRVEGYLKYQEMAFDLAQLGYKVFIIDHQGQGLSSRLLVNSHKGHVNHYDDYTRDFNQFVTEIVAPKQVGEMSLVCHSMGGAIGLRYLQQYDHPFKRAVFSSPMWGLPTGPVPASILKPMVKSAAWLVKQVEPQSPYFLGNSDYKKVPFLINTLTHSKPRYELFRSIYEDQPDLQLGGITYGWLVASINALEKAYDELDKVTIPVLVLQSEKDIVIDNTAQDMFCERLAEVGNACNQNKPVVIKGAKHEVFIEKDEIRNKGLSEVLAFLNTDSQT